MSAKPDPGALAETPSARAAALDILCQVLGRHRPFDEVLDTHPGLAGLESRDRAFAHLLAATVLRRLGQLDALIGQCLARPLPLKAEASRNLLRLGAAQLFFLGTPPHAAVGESVELAGAADGGGYKGLINAVLRRLAAEGEGRLAAQDAARLNTPDWLWRSWNAAYGGTAARAIAEMHLSEPPLDLTAKGDPAPWAEPLAAELLPTGSLRRQGGGDLRALPGFAEGAWWVQDAAAALPARLLGEVAGKRVFDLCAAPGGKTAQLAAAGARVTAVDRSTARLRRLAENLARLGLAASIIAADAGMWRPEDPADAVLLDAPCTATGTIRRHPDIPWLKRPEDVSRMAVEQDRLLRAALAMLRPGGVLVYTTCSLEPAEGPGRVAALLAGGAPLRRLPVAASETGGLAELLTPEGELRTLPCHLAERGGLDGFYAARLARL
jgi:16S rRNA (cytosine967-C5)-methyltransferase